ncbi:MAG TPA: hypothetical protein VLL50_11960 [Usitatibacter sp.]|nr:hypothetical protein [Usitatibacter sp.]
MGSLAFAAQADDAVTPELARMQALHQAINDPKSTMDQRQAAREELANLLKSPAGQAPAPRPRAAIEPIGPIVKPAINPPISTPPVAHVEVTQPPRTTVTPSGIAAAPASSGTAIDPRNGHVLTETPNGYIDPRTGHFTPK